MATQLRPGQVTTFGSHTVPRDDSGSFIVLLESEAALNAATLVIDGSTISIEQLGTQLASPLASNSYQVLMEEVSVSVCTENDEQYAA
ncbi:hypothetical protein ACJQWK_10956 [Exserohilum turcicum]